MFFQNESEYKYLLEKSDFLWLFLYAKKHYSAENDIIQINYYYDTPDNNYNINNETIRIRQIGENLSLQRKKHIMTENNLYKSEELIEKLDTLPLNMECSGTNDIVYFKGALITERKIYKPETGINLIFDTNYYLGTCDYEIEIEFDYSKKNRVSELLNKLCIQNTENVKNKSSRFFDKLSSLQSL